MKFFKQKIKGSNNTQVIGNDDRSIIRDDNGTAVIDGDGIRITRNGVTTTVGYEKPSNDFKHKYELLLDMIASNQKFDSYEKKEATEFLKELCKDYLESGTSEKEESSMTLAGALWFFNGRRQ